MSEPSIQDLISDRPSSTRDAIIRGAWLCFQEKGAAKTTIAAISRAAGVSRGTVYQYFPDSDAIFRATTEQASQTFYAVIAEELAGVETFAGQIEHIAVFLCTAKQWIPLWGEAFDAERVALLTTVYSEILMNDFVGFLTPYVEIAKVRGEVRADLDASGAAEWLARILFSLFTTPSPHRDFNDPEVTRQFIREFAILGLSGAGVTPQGARQAR